MGGGLLPDPIQGVPDTPATAASVSALLLASTANTAVLTYTPPETQGLSLRGGVEVTGAATVVQAYITWTGKDGQPKTLWWAGTAQGGWSLAPDAYSFFPASVTALGGTPVTVYVQAQTAGQVSFSGIILVDE